jgi:pimeloyl-ACP methyl ester carboxylesterase
MARTKIEEDVMRRCIEIQVSGLRLRGTFHQRDGAAGEIAGICAGATGVILLNSGFLPRSAQGDLLARMGDRYAKAGMPVFRFDLPGLGESEGDLPEDAVSFVQSVERGGFGPYVSALAAKLVQLYKLDKVIVGGLCGGGMSSLWGAAAHKHVKFDGVMMLDPIFSQVQVQELPGQKKSGWAQWKANFQLRKKAFYEELRIWILAQRIAAPLQRFYSRIKAARVSQRAAEPKSVAQSLPKVTNVKLIQCFERLMTAQLPILVVTAHDPRRAGTGFDYMNYILRGERFRAEHRVIEGTNHSFLEGNGPRALMDITEEWLTAHFVKPAADRQKAAVTDNLRQENRAVTLPIPKAFPAAGGTTAAS